VPHPRKVSQTQLARELGISQALVSLVLNGRRRGISLETYERVWEHAVKRGYHPKGMHLASSPTAQAKQVAIILRAPFRLNTPSLYFGHVQHGLHAELEAQGFTTAFVGTEGDLSPAKLRRIFGAGHAFAGIVLLGEVARPFFDELRKFGLPIVAASARYPGVCDSVVGDEAKSLDSLIDHLVELGHRRIGWLGGNVGLGRHESRLTALETSLKRVGLTLHPRYTVKLTHGDRAEGSEAAHAVLAFRARKDFPTAWVCYNAAMAQGAIKAFTRAGWQIPRDLSVVGADASPIALKGNPRITAAGSCPEELGQAAARLILESNDRAESVRDLILPSRFFAGESSGPAPR
jgi:LacI family transcriptional regulator